MFEKKKHRLLTKTEFALRMGAQLGMVLLFLSVSLGVGILAYRELEGFSWIDSLLNASMILGGMGEIDTLKTDAGKLFASAYSIYSGFFMIVCGGLLLAPVFHRILHHFHAE